MASLNDVPDHVLMEIFSFLPLKTLIEVTEVSDRWSSLIESSQSTMKRFCLQITFCEEHKHKSIKNSIPMGRHVNLCFHGFNKSMEARDLYEFFRMNYIEFIKVLPLSTIQSIHFKNFDTIGRPFYRRLPKPARIQWKVLKSLKFENGTFGDVKDFLSDKISKLELIEATFDAESVNDLFSAEQAVNYQELRIIKTDINEKKLVDVIKLKSLRVVEFDLKYLLKNSVLLALLSGYKWKTLSFMGIPINHDIVRRIIEKVIESNPAVTKILVKDASLEDKYEFLTKISTYLPNIEHILLPTIFDEFPKSPMQFPKLHTLEIEGVSNPAQMNCIGELIRISCPSLKTLKLYWIGCHAMKKIVLENLLTSAEHLEELHLGAKSDLFELSLEEVEVIKAKGKNLKRLTVFTSFPDKMQATLAGFHDTQIHATAWDRNHEKPEEHELSLEKLDDIKAKEKNLGHCEVCKRISYRLNRFNCTNIHATASNRAHENIIARKIYLTCEFRL